MPRRLLAVRQGLSDRRALRSVHDDPAACVSALTTWSGWDLTTEPAARKDGALGLRLRRLPGRMPLQPRRVERRRRISWALRACEVSASYGDSGSGLRYAQKHRAACPLVHPADKVWRYKTNALNVMPHDYSPEYLSAIKKACSDEAEPVRKMAAWVLTELKISAKAGGTEARVTENRQRGAPRRKTMRGVQRAYRKRRSEDDSLAPAFFRTFCGALNISVRISGGRFSRRGGTAPARRRTSSPRRRARRQATT